MIELMYWVAVAAVGAGAAIVSFWVGLTYRGYLQHARPELLKAYWPELVRDGLLVAGLSLNLTAGITSLLPKTQAAMVVTLVSVLGGATCMSLFAVFNLALRIGR